MNAAGPAATRLAGLDGLKGLCIAGVVLIHAAPPAPDWYATLVVGGLTRLAVPVFLAITGFLAGWRGSDRQRFRRQFLTFLRLHLIYGAFYWALALLSDGSAGETSLKGLLLHFGEAAWPGQYYLLVLVQVFLVAGWLLPEHFWRSWHWPCLAAGVALVGLAVSSWAAALAETFALSRYGYRVLATENGVWLWFQYFALGAALGARARQSDATREKSPVLIAVVAAAALIAISGLPAIPDWEEPARHPYARLPIFAGATLLALCLPQLARLAAPRWLASLGRESFGVYVLNPAVLTLLAKIAGPPEGLGSSWLHALAAIALALPLTKVVRRVAPAALP